MNARPERRRRIIRFADCALNLQQRVLVRNGIPVDLQPRPFSLLEHLIENRDRVVSRDEITERVWNGTAVNGQALRFAVHAVRRAVGDDGRAQRVIQTVSRVGLRFVADVRFESESAEYGEPGLMLQREQAVRAAEMAMASAEKAQGRAIVALGPAGIGKTTYLKHLRAVSRRAGFVVELVRCVDFGETPPFWPWTVLLRQLGERFGERHESVAYGQQRPEIAWLVPELAADSVQGGSAERSVARWDVRSARFRLFDAVAQELAQLSTQEPLALLFDDLQEVDPESRSLFRYLASRLDDCRILLAGTIRLGSRWSDEESEVESLIGRTSVTTMRLEPLGAPSVARLVEIRTGVRVSESISEDLIAYTGGNPYFLGALLDSIRDDDRWRRILCGEECLERCDVPESVQEVIWTRLSCLSAEAQELLRVASVVGAEVPVGVLEVVLSADEVMGRIGEAVEAGMLEIRNPEGLCRFPHALVRETIYARLKISERARLHRRVGIALEEFSNGQIGPHCAEIARHFAGASGRQFAVRAIEYLLQAAKWSAERAAFATARDQLKSALRLAGDAAPSDRLLKCRVLLELGFLEGVEGRRDEMQRSVWEAAEIAKEIGSGEQLARAAMLYAPDLLVIETGVYDAALVSLLEEALVLVADSCVGERVRLLARLAMALHWSDENVDRIESLIENARSLVSGTSDEGLGRYVERAARIALYSVEEPRRNLDHCQEVNVTEGPAALLDDVLRISGLLQLGRVREVDVRIEEFAVKQEMIHCSSATWYVKMFRGTMALMRGEYSAAREFGDVYLRQGALVQDQNATHSYALQRVMAAIDEGGLESLEGSVSAMAENFPRVNGWRAGLCYLYAEMGENARARDLIEALGGEAAWAQARRNSWFGAVCAMTLACRVLDYREIASKLYEVLVPMRGQLAVVGFGSFCWGATDRFLGVLASLMDEPDLAGRHFSAAVRLNARCGAGPAVAHCYREMAYFGYQVGAERAAEYSEMAIRRARRLGMRRLEEGAVRDRNSH